MRLKAPPPTIKIHFKKLDNTGFSKILENSAVTGMKGMCGPFLLL